jgi:hypothetical protein
MHCIFHHDARTARVCPLPLSYTGDSKRPTTIHMQASLTHGIYLYNMCGPSSLNFGSGVAASRLGLVLLRVWISSD